MARFAGYRLIKALAVLAALAQVITAGFISAAAPADLARLICLPSGHASTATDAALSDLLTALDLDGDAAPDGMGAGCSLCVLAHGAPPAQPDALQEPALFATPADLSLAHEATVKQAKRGLPIGGRAPPFFS